MRRTRAHSSAGSHTRHANAGTRNPRRSTRAAQDSNAYRQGHFNDVKTRNGTGDESCL